MNSDRRYLQRRLFVLCTEAGIKDKCDRLDYANYTINKGHHITSFVELSTDEMKELIQGLVAWQNIQTLRMANGALREESRAWDEFEQELQHEDLQLNSTDRQGDREERENG